MVSVVGVGVGREDEVLSQRAVVALGNIVEFSHRKPVVFVKIGEKVEFSHRKLDVFVGMGARLVVLSQRPVVMLAARVGNAVLGHLDLVSLANNGRIVDVFCHRGTVLL